MNTIVKGVDLKKVLGIKENKHLYSNEESLAITSTNYWVNMSTYLMLAFVFVPIVMAIFWFVSWCFNIFGMESIGKHIYKQLKSFWNKMFFGNSIKAQTATYLPQAISFLIYMRTIDNSNHILTLL